MSQLWRIQLFKMGLQTSSSPSSGLPRHLRCHIPVLPLSILAHCHQLQALARRWKRRTCSLRPSSKVFCKRRTSRCPKHLKRLRILTDTIEEPEREAAVDQEEVKLMDEWLADDETAGMPLANVEVTTETLEYIVTEPVNEDAAAREAVEDNVVLLEDTSMPVDNDYEVEEPSPVRLFIQFLIRCIHNAQRMCCFQPHAMLLRHSPCQQNHQQYMRAQKMVDHFPLRVNLHWQEACLKKENRVKKSIQLQLLMPLCRLHSFQKVLRGRRLHIFSPTSTVT
jgi:hypothetical protein